MYNFGKKKKQRFKKEGTIVLCFAKEPCNLSPSPAVMGSICFSFPFSGSNLLLQRIMAKKGVPSDLTFVAFDSTTSLCTSSYVSLQKKNKQTKLVKCYVYACSSTP